MNFNKVRETIKAKNFQLDYFAINVAGMTPDGFRLALDKETLKVITLEKISNALKIPMNYWWDDKIDLFSLENSNDLLIQKLKNDIDRKDQIIDDQLKTIKDLRNRIDSLEGKYKTKRAV
jgi:hypothetical protein